MILLLLLHLLGLFCGVTFLCGATLLWCLACIFAKGDVFRQMREIAVFIAVLGLIVLSWTVFL